MCFYPQFSNVVDAADFDGTSDYMSRDAFTGAVDSKSGTMTLFFRVDGGDGAARNIFNMGFGGANAGLNLSLDTSNKLVLLARNSTPTTILSATSTGTFAAGATWHHLVLSFDLSTPTFEWYVDDSAEAAATTTVDDSVVWTSANVKIGASGTNSNRFNGALAEVALWPGRRSDLSVTSNRRKFSDASNKPTNLGVAASGPFGIAAITYQTLRDGEAVADFAINRGAGGDFSITGTLETSSSSPSD